MIKQICKAVGVKITKSTVAKGVSKAIPLLGGVISGSLNFASMMPMANRLQVALDSAVFGYTEEQMEKDIMEIESVTEESVDEPIENDDVKTKINEGGKKALDSIAGLFGKKNEKSAQTAQEDVFETIKKLSALKDIGAITQEEFDAKKAELLAKL